MINVSEIRTNLFGVVGLRQPYNPDYDILDSTITASSSGVYFDQYSPYVSVENIKDTQPYASITVANFTTWITNAMKDSISKAMLKCFQSNDLIENALLYENSNRKDVSFEIPNGSDFVGYEIEVAKNKDLTAIVNSIFAEFSGIGTVKVLLLNADKTAILQSKSITIATKSVTQSITGWSLPYSNSVTGGKYYIGYLTSGLVPKAINREYNLANLKHRYNGISIKPIKVTGWNSESLFDIDDVEYTSETWGLNFDISIFKDYTSLIVNNKNMFVDVIGYQFAADMLGMMYTSLRTNGTERLQKANILLELQGNFNNTEYPTVRGVETKLKDAIKEVQQKLTIKDQIKTVTLR